MGEPLTWHKFFNISDEEARAPHALRNCLLQGSIDQDAYLTWARETYMLPSVTGAFFTAPIEGINWPTAFELYAWTEDFLPLAIWEGILLIGCIEPRMNLALDCEFRQVLAPARQLQSLWSKLRTTSASASQITQKIPAAEEAAPATKPAFELPEGLSGLHAGSPSESESHETAPAPAHDGPVGFDLPDGLTVSSREILGVESAKMGENDALEGLDDFTNPADLEGTTITSDPSDEKSSFIIVEKIFIDSAPADAGSDESARPFGGTTDTIIRPVVFLKEEVDLDRMDSTSTKTIPPIEVEEEMIAAPPPPMPSNPPPEIRTAAASPTAGDPISPANTAVTKLRTGTVTGFFLRGVVPTTPTQTAQAAPATASQMPKPPIPEAILTPPPIPTPPSASISPPPIPASVSATPPPIPAPAPAPAPASAPPPIPIPTPISAAPSVGRVFDPSVIKAKEISDCQTIDDLCNAALASLLLTFDGAMVLLHERDNLTPWRWTQALATSDSDKFQTVDLATPSIFRIVMRSRLPYHGPVHPSVENNRFFAAFFHGRLPAHVTMVPVLIDKKVAGMLLAASEKATDFRLILPAIEHLAQDVGQRYAKFRSVVAA